MGSREDVVERFDDLCGETGGIDSWIGPETRAEVLDRLASIADEPLSKGQLTQLLVLSHESGVSHGFFEYYWLSAPASHSYPVASVPGYDRSYFESGAIVSMDHLHWGLCRLYIDALLYFGNIRTGFRSLRTKSTTELASFFDERRFDTEAMKQRGPSLPIDQFPKDDRYLISEMACKSYDAAGGSQSRLHRTLVRAWEAREATGDVGGVTIDGLLAQSEASEGTTPDEQLRFSAEEILSDEVRSREELDRRYEEIAVKFEAARRKALSNTDTYLSMVSDLDVYVATSMRKRDQFRRMADVCERVFQNEILAPFHLRYFDPTLAAAEGHEDKGLVECLMVKTAKALVYTAGASDSFGKDAEAAMALSLGKPVIFLCDEGTKASFYREVHPLSRLIDFNTGVAVGAIVAIDEGQVAELLRRVFSNEMVYRLAHEPKRRRGYFRLREELTDSVVRLQTNNALLRETFWNYYSQPRSHSAR